MNERDVKNLILSLLRPYQQAAHDRGFVEGIVAAQNDPDGVVTMGHYEEQHLGPHDFIEELVFPYGAIEEFEAEVGFSMGRFDRMFEQREEGIHNETVWSAYVTGYNGGVRTIRPDAPEAGE